MTESSVPRAVTNPRSQENGLGLARVQNVRRPLLPSSVEDQASDEQGAPGTDLNLSLAMIVWRTLAQDTGLEPVCYRNSQDQPSTVQLSTGTSALGGTWPLWKTDASCLSI